MRNSSGVRTASSSWETEFNSRRMHFTLSQPGAVAGQEDNHAPVCETRAHGFGTAGKCKYLFGVGKQIWPKRSAVEGRPSSKRYLHLPAVPNPWALVSQYWRMIRTPTSGGVSTVQHSARDAVHVVDGITLRLYAAAVAQDSH